MKKGLALLVALLAFSGVASAYDLPGNVSEGLKGVKSGVDALNPQPEAIYRFDKGEWDGAVAASLYDVISNEYHLGRAKIGYGMSNYGYLGADVDLPGVLNRFAGGKLAVVDKLSGLWSRYGSTGVHGGRDFEAEEWDWGFTIGATIPLP